MMIRRKTFLVTLGTVVRLLGLAAILAFLTRSYSGAVVGVLALSACIIFETFYAVALGWRFYRDLERQVQPVPGYLELWRFSWPIFFMQTAESGMTFTVNLFLGRLARPEVALAAYAVLDSLVRVLLSPLRNLVHTTQTLVRTRADARVILIFATHMALAFAALMALLTMPAIERLALLDIMGLTPALIADIRPGMQLGTLLALAMAGATVLRGLLITSHNTGYIAVSAVLRIAIVTVVGSVALWLGVENGAQLGIAALIAAFSGEALLLGIRSRQLDRAPLRLFVDSAAGGKPHA
jgi:Na+-driven multidrug efflux pump